VAITFIESGGDATGGLDFYGTITGSVAVSNAVTITGPNVIACNGAAGAVATASTPALTNVNGGRLSFNVQIGALPSSTVAIAGFGGNSSFTPFLLKVTSAGVLQLTIASGTQIGSDGPTLSAGVTYRICISASITNTSTYSVAVYVDGSSAITGANTPTLGGPNTSTMFVGWLTSPGSGNKVIYFDDLYYDETKDGTDVGNVNVTAKLPAATNTNNFSSTGGSGAARYNYVDDRPIDLANYIAHTSQTDVQENFGLQANTAGDVNISGATILARRAWIYAKRGPGTVEHRASVASGSTNPTTTFTITIPSGTLTDDVLFVGVTSRDHTSGTGYPTVTDNDTGGNAWAKFAEDSRPRSGGSGRPAPRPTRRSLWRAAWGRLPVAWRCIPVSIRAATRMRTSRYKRTPRARSRIPVTRRRMQEPSTASWSAITTTITLYRAFPPRRSVHTTNVTSSSQRAVATARARSGASRKRRPLRPGQSHGRRRMA
jgi:hypothetical protein